jgi:pimeloyl-ACP methyl ester carboxylesterase
MVVLIHGIGLNRQLWQWQLPALSKSYRVLRYDLPGHGDTPPLAEDLSLACFSRQLRDLLDELEISRAALIGFSLGGMINRRFALDHPERVSALAILNSPHERSEEAQGIVEERLAKTAAGGPAATLDTTLARWFTPAFLQDQLAVIAQVREWVLAAERRSYEQCRQVLATGVTELVRPEPPIRVPTIVITAEDDSGSTPAMAQAIAGEIAGAQCVIVPELQHMGLIENPAAFIGPVLGFLETLKAAGKI